MMSMRIFLILLYFSAIAIITKVRAYTASGTVLWTRKKSILLPSSPSTSDISTTQEEQRQSNAKKLSLYRQRRYVSFSSPKQRQQRTLVGLCATVTTKNDEELTRYSQNVSLTDTLYCSQEEEKMIYKILLDCKVNPSSTPWYTNNNATSSTRPESSTRTFNYLLQLMNDHCHPSSSDTNTAATTTTIGQKAENVLRYMLNQQPERPEIKPDQLTLNLVLAAYAGGSKNINMLVEISGAKQEQQQSRNSRSYQRKQQEQLNSAQTAYSLLKEWDDLLYPSDKVSHPSDRVSYNTILSAFAKTGQYEQAEEVFQELQKKAQAVNSILYQPNIFSYNCLLKAYATNGQAYAAAQILQQMLTINNIPKPTIHSYNDVLYAYAKSNQPVAAYEFLLEWISSTTISKNFVKNKKYNKSRNKKTSRKNVIQEMIQPDLYSYNVVLYAMAEAIKQENKQIVLSQQDQQRQLSQQRQQRVRIITRSIPSSSSSASISAVNSNKKIVDEKDRKNNNDDFDMGDIDKLFVGGSSSSNNNYGDKSSAIVNMMQQLFDNMPIRNTISYTTFIGALCETAKKKETKITIKNYDNNDVIVKALEKIRTVIQRAYWDPSVSSKIDASFFSNILFSLAVIEDVRAAVFADEVVQTMVNEYKIQPTVKLYNSLIYCWGKSSIGSSQARSLINAVDQSDVCQRLLDIIQELEDHPVLEPSTITYTNALSALKTSSSTTTALGIKAVEFAELILVKMEQNVDCLPNVVTYTAMIQNYAYSRLPYKAVKAIDVLQRMKQVSVHPNIISYNAVLNACEHTDPSIPAVSEEALKVACLVFDEVRASSKVQPNHLTYGSFLGTLAKQMPSVQARQEIVGLVFRKCCYDGQVSKLVLKKLRMASDPEIYRSLLMGHSEDRLPPNWTRNVLDDTRARSYLHQM